MPALTCSDTKRLLERLAYKKSPCHKDKTLYFYPVTLGLYWKSVLILQNQWTWTFFPWGAMKSAFSMHLPGMLALKMKKNVDVSHSLMELYIYSDFLWIKPARYFYWRGWGSLRPHQTYCTRALDPLIIGGGPMQWVVNCMRNLGSFGGEANHKANSSLSTLICFCLLSTNHNEFL